MENNYFDDSIKKELEEFEAKFNPDDWDLMEQRLDLEDKLRTRLFYIKGIEVALMLLLVFTVAQFLPLKRGAVSPSLNPDMEVKIPSNESAPIQNQNSPFPTETIEEVQPENKQPESKEAPTKQATSNQIFAAANKDKQPRVQIESNTEAAMPSNTFKVDVASALPSPTIYQNATPTIRIVPFSSSPQAKVDVENNSIVDQELKATAEVDEMSSIVLAENIENVNDLGLIKISNGFPTLNTSLPQQKKVRFGMYFRPDANLVYTPIFLEIDEDKEEVTTLKSYSTAADGYSGGFSFGLSNGKLELETGLEYSFLSYKPKPLGEVSGELFNTLQVQTVDNIEYNFLTIPINVNYNVSNIKDLKFYVKGGAALNLVARAKVDKVLEKIGKSRSLFEVSPSFESGIFVKDDSKFKDRFSDNNFISANIGFGVEKVLNNRLGVFVEPSYSHTLFGNGLVPNKDRINRISLSVGAKVTL